MNQIERDNLLAAATGGRSYPGVPALTPSEQAHATREAEHESLRRRLAKVEAERTARIDLKHRYRETR